MPVMAAGRSEEETEKRVGAAMMTGQALISIDNVNGELGGDFLGQAVERPSVQVRILGKSEQIQIEPRGTTFFATGNNIRILGDMNRRIVISTMDPRVERPELREFNGDPFMKVTTERGKYIAAALTIGHAYALAGRPGMAKRLASFEGWSDCVRSALIWLDEADPVGSMEFARQDDPDRETLSAMLTAWADVLGVGYRYKRTLADVIAISEEKSTGITPLWPDLHDAIEAACGGRRNTSTLHGLGFWMRGKQNRIVDGLKLMHEKRGKAKHWWIEGEEERPGHWDNPTSDNTGGLRPLR
jgi:hypothetical protein